MDLSKIIKFLSRRGVQLDEAGQQILRRLAEKQERLYDIGQAEHLAIESLPPTVESSRLRAQRLAGEGDPKWGSLVPEERPSQLQRDYVVDVLDKEHGYAPLAASIGDDMNELYRYLEAREQGDLNRSWKDAMEGIEVERRSRAKTGHLTPKGRHMADSYNEAQTLPEAVAEQNRYILDNEDPFGEELFTEFERFKRGI